MQILLKYRWFLVLPLVTAIGAVILAFDQPAAHGTATTLPTSAPEIVVDISGAVVSPGIHRVPEGSLVEDVITAAGGLTPQADLIKIAREVNRAEKVKSHQKILIPIIGETRAVTGEPSESAPININEATLSELEKLPGIGPSIAQRIIDYREQNGPFSAPEDLQNVSGISEKRFAELKDRVTV